MKFPSRPVSLDDCFGTSFLSKSSFSVTCRQVKSVVKPVIPSAIFIRKRKQFSWVVWYSRQFIFSFQKQSILCMYIVSALSFLKDSRTLFFSSTFNRNRSNITVEITSNGGDSFRCLSHRTLEFNVVKIIEGKQIF